ncbi:hypothetical protein O181_050540 [Austropuccinia psidii MF-1]|uniref:Integrase catalytic domain-containing protein n=1 Tax=Austropuccinia psidii MF-1 TaxID=1389203 RepID=A0A9Q3DVI8_9BASI|nr:hypothetical protein [Austropuccinia psidii MF-1]
MLDKERHHANMCIQDSFEYSNKRWDKSDKPPAFKRGDLVLVSALNSNIIEGPKKLKDSFAGPFMIRPLDDPNSVQQELTALDAAKRTKAESDELDASNDACALITTTLDSQKFSELFNEVTSQNSHKLWKIINELFASSSFNSKARVWIGLEVGDIILEFTILTKLPEEFQPLIEKSTLNSKQQGKPNNVLKTLHEKALKGEALSSESSKAVALNCKTFPSKTVHYCANVKLLKHKNETLTHFKEFKNAAKNFHSKKIKRIISDGGGEFKNNYFEQLCSKSGIKRCLSPAYTPQHNGISKRGNRSIIEKARCLLIQFSLPMKFCSEAIATAAFLCSLIPKKENNTRSFEHWYHQKPPLKHLKPFGCKSRIQISPQLCTQKFSPVSWEGVLLGYENNGSSYRILKSWEQAVVISRHVVFDKITFHSISSPKTISTSPDLRSLFLYSNRNPRESTDTTLPEPISEQLELPTKEEEEQESLSEALEFQPSRIKVIDQRHPTLISSDINPANILSFHRRPRTNLTQTMVDEVPNFYNKALSGLNKEKWDKEIKTELRNMEKVKIKKDATGNPVEYKFHQIDIKSVFLNAPLEDDVAIEVPQGLTLNKNSLVLQLNKALYGLRQSPLAWHNHLSKWLIGLNFTQSISDPCVFWKPAPDPIWIYIHVDNLALFGPNLD